MNRRTKILAWGALGIAAFWLVALGIRGFVMAPLVTLDGQISQLQAKLVDAQEERQKFVAAEKALGKIGGRTFGTTPDLVAAELGALLTKQVLQAGLEESDFTRLPVGEQRLPGAVEVGWTLQGEGPLKQVVDLLFLLDQDPRLHRIEGLSLSSGGEPGQVRVRLRFLTLLLNPPSTASVETSLEPARLDVAERAFYDPILTRDLLRPYIPGGSSRGRTASQGSEQATESPNDSSPPWSLLKIVSLSTWGGDPEAHLRHTSDGSMRVLRPGDAMGEVEVLAIDYRPMSHPEKPGIRSYSRVILKESEDYYAVECGQTLDQRRSMPFEDLPDRLRQ